MGIAEKLSAAAADRLGMPTELIAGTPRVEIVGTRRVTVENHRGIVALGESEIKIAGSVSVTIRGDGLSVAAMTAREVLITGLVLSVELEN